MAASTAPVHGGAGGDGTLFRITTRGAFTLLYSFLGLSDGASPNPLIQGSDGSFYGTCQSGGANGTGTVFKITAGGVFTLLHAFSLNGAADGEEPLSGLAEGSDGAYYGTCMFGGAYDYGTVFRITPAGAFSVVYSFQGGADGAMPAAPVVQGSDGNLYGTCSAAGLYQSGTIFKLNLTGFLVPLHSFDPVTDGAYVLERLLQANDGN
ncbi:MAG TPA: choice-of-anchor tandem repeat GloVer-containing protein, partial [Chthonomonadales bacterium]|nr:choice-of-anchor tandem repeat GloVer-containing protein [Chthonomonadales bacterium]